jgi:Tol biopolymer transport system component
MSRPDGFDRSLAQWLNAEVPPAATTEVLERALAVTGGRRPRPRLVASIGSHWVDDGPHGTATATFGRRATSPTAGILLALLALVTALVLGAVALGMGAIRPAPDIRHLGHLAYVTDDGLYVADWDGANARRLVDPRQELAGLPEGCRAFFGTPKWSPDGRHLAIRTEWSDLCQGSIIITDAEGSSLTTIPGSGWDFAWSPDSGRIVTWVEIFKSIGVFGIDGRRQAMLPRPWRMTSGDHDPGWTHDGSALLVPNGVVVPLDGSTPYVMRSLTSVRSAVSPDGTRVASPKWNEQRSVVVAALDGSSERVFDMAAPATVTRIMWSPTGDRIAIGVERGGPILLDPATGATTGLDLASVGVALGEQVEVISFSPDGDRLLVRADERASSLWSIEVNGAGARKLVEGTNGGDWQWLPAGS